MALDVNRLERRVSGFASAAAGVRTVWLQVFYTTGPSFQSAWARGSNVILGGGNP
jgi:hypothetical protein